MSSFPPKRYIIFTPSKDDFWSRNLSREMCCNSCRSQRGTKRKIVHSFFRSIFFPFWQFFCRNFSMKWQQCSEWGNNDVLKNLDWISSVLLLLKCSYELEFAKILPKKICIFCLLYQKCKSESSFFYTWQFLQIRPQNTPILTTVNNPFFAEFLIYGKKTANKLFLPCHSTTE